MQQALTKPQPAKVSFWQFFITQEYSVREIDSDNKYSFWSLSRVILMGYPANLKEAEIWQVNKEIDNFIVLQPRSILLINGLKIIDVDYEEILSSTFRVDCSNFITIFISSLISDGEIIWEYENRPVNERTIQFAHYLCKRIGEMKHKMHIPSIAIQE